MGNWVVFPASLPLINSNMFCKQSTNRWIVGAAVTVFGLVGLNSQFAFTSVSSFGSGHLRATNFATHPRPTAGVLDNRASSTLLAPCSIGSILLLAGALALRRATIIRHAQTPKKMQLEQIPRPENLLESPKFPPFQGSSGGYVSRSTKERHAMTWVAPSQKVFEMPTGGCAVMNKGDNLIYFRKKEHCICLTKALRKQKINDIKVYRIQKDGTVLFMHPLDGLWPEQATNGRPLTNWRPFPTGSNPQGGALKWSKYHGKAYEADPLTRLFVRARAYAFADQESLFPLPVPEGWVENAEQKAAYDQKLSDAISKVQDLPPVQ